MLYILNSTTKAAKVHFFQDRIHKEMNSMFVRWVGTETETTLLMNDGSSIKMTVEGSIMPIHDARRIWERLVENGWNRHE